MGSKDSREEPSRLSILMERPAWGGIAGIRFYARYIYSDERQVPVGVYTSRFLIVPREDGERG